MSRSSVWTPRRTTRLWHQDAGFASTTSGVGGRTSPTGGNLERVAFNKKFTFAPDVNPAWSAPPPPAPIKKQQLNQGPPRIPSDDLRTAAVRLREQAEELQDTAPAPSLKVQLGLELLKKDDYIKKILKDWDARGKGELLKGELRQNLRNIGLVATSAEADALFDSWDDDKGGSLDMKELKTALQQCQDAANVYKGQPDPNQLQAAAARKRADLADEAATAVQQLFSGKKGSEAAGKEQGSTAQEIDAVFESFDSDGGGYMDMDEAKSMIKALHKAAETAEHEKKAKEKEANAMRAKATKLAAVAMSPLPSADELAQQAEADMMAHSA